MVLPMPKITSDHVPCKLIIGTSIPNQMSFNLRISGHNILEAMSCSVCSSWRTTKGCSKEAGHGRKGWQCTSSTEIGSCQTARDLIDDAEARR